MRLSGIWPAWAGRTNEAGDVRGTAEHLIAALGVQATCHATYEALKARQRGDRSRMDQWLWIAGATREILRSDPEAEAAG